MRFKKVMLCLAILAIFTLAFSGCATKATGGGWIYSSLEREAKATFGFVAMVDPADLPEPDENGFRPMMMGMALPAKGNLQIVDHGGDGFKFHADVEGFVTYMDEHSASFSGEGLCEDELRYVTVFVRDDDWDGKFDFISVVVYGEYFNMGILQGGNINIK